MPGDSAQLYKEDFVLWAKDQAAALRRAASAGLELDWENLAEEIESLGISQRRELLGRLVVILEHLIRLERSPAASPRGGWMATIGRERLNIEELLQDSPSLRQEIGPMIATLEPRVARFAAASLSEFGETMGAFALRGYTEEQVLGDWFPGEAPLPEDGERG